MVPTDYFYDSADGLRLYCGLYSARSSGGLPVLCLPGLTRNSRDFVALAERLSELHDVLTADLRGRGRSAWDPDHSTASVPRQSCGRSGYLAWRLDGDGHGRHEDGAHCRGLAQ